MYKVLDPKVIEQIRREVKNLTGHSRHEQVDPLLKFEFSRYFRIGRNDNVQFCTILATTLSGKTPLNFLLLVNSPDIYHFDLVVHEPAFHWKRTVLMGLYKPSLDQKRKSEILIMDTPYLMGADLRSQPLTIRSALLLGLYRKSEAPGNLVEFGLKSQTFSLTTPLASEHRPRGNCVEIEDEARFTSTRRRIIQQKK